MTSPTPAERRFIEALEGLAAREDRAALAALRRGLGRPPGEAAEPYPYVVPWIPADVPPWVEEAYFLVAALFALHPMSWRDDGASNAPTNLGASFARLRAAEQGGGAERRFVALLDSHPDDLPHHLRHAISLLRSREIPVDWARLLHDVQRWNRPGRQVQRAWARAFWAPVEAAAVAVAGAGYQGDAHTDAVDV